MSTPRDRVQLKSYLQTGDRPTQAQFADLVDGMVNQESDNFYITDDQDVGVGTDSPARKLHVTGKTYISTDINRPPDTHNALEIFAGASHGIAINTEGNDVFNFLDDSGKDNPPFTFVDHARRGFRFYNSNNGEQLRIADSGNVGVGPIWNDASARLQVNGPSADEDQPGILRIEATGGNQNSANLRLGVMKDDYSWIQSHGSKPLHINRIGNHTLLNRDGGYVGIGVSVPDNKLHLHNGDDQIPLQQTTGQTGGGGVAGKSSGPMTANDTGLRLSTGSANGRILVSDDDGNAYWKEPTVVTNGLWKDIGTTGHIENGNSGRVGIGTNAPNEKLTVFGDIGMHQSGSLFLRTNDVNHGIGWYGHDSNEGLQKFFAGNSVNGPVVHGYNGGVLGSMRSHEVGNEQNIAMSWFRDQSVEFQGNIRIKQHSPILIRRFAVNESMLKFPDSFGKKYSAFDTGVLVSDYQAAAITGYAGNPYDHEMPTSRNSGTNHSHQYNFKNAPFASLFKENNTWHVEMYLWGTAGWNVDIMFLRGEIATITGDWSKPLSEQANIIKNVHLGGNED